jgi:hypothetical protein
MPLSINLIDPNDPAQVPAVVKPASSWIDDEIAKRKRNLTGELAPDQAGPPGPVPNAAKTVGNNSTNTVKLDLSQSPPSEVAVSKKPTKVGGIISREMARAAGPVYNPYYDQGTEMSEVNPYLKR